MASETYVELSFLVDKSISRPLIVVFFVMRKRLCLQLPCWLLGQARVVLPKLSNVNIILGVPYRTLF